MSFESVLLEDLAAPQKNAIVGGPFGSNLVSKDYVDQGTPVIRGQNMGGRWVSGDFAYVSAMKAGTLSPNKARPGDLIFTQRGTLGQVSIVPSGPYDEYIVSQSQMKVTLDPKRADVHFLYYVFRSPEQLEYIQNTAIQTGVPHTNLGILKKTPLKLPPIHMQRQIATILGSLDDRITLLRETNATLEAIAQALFKSWFVDFDPVRAKMEGRAPEGIDEATAALFPDSLEETELGLVPKGWEASTLGSLCELTKGCSYKGDGLSEAEGAFMFNLGCFNAQRVFANEKVKRYTGEYRPRHAVSPGDLIIANTDMTQARDILGRPVFVPNGFEPGFVSHHVFKVTVRALGSHDTAALRNYLFFTFREPTFRERAIGFATGTTVLALPASAVTDCPTCIPDAASLLAWNEIVQPLFDTIRSNEESAENLVSLRDTLLPRLISGQLRLPEAASAVEHACE